MKVYVGPYINWVGPYQIADFIGKILRLSEERSEKLGDWLADTPVDKFCTWVNSKRKRKIKVRIDYHDVWSADHTLALIILPVLEKLKEVQHGFPTNTDDDDVPEHMRSIHDVLTENDNEKYNFESQQKRWEYILDEMIFAFRSIVDDSWEEQFYSGTAKWETVPLENGNFQWKKTEDSDDKFDFEGYKAYADRIANGTRLFGKYYRNLWD